MSQRSKKELSEEIYPRYLKAKKAEKKRILDEFIAATGYHRKYAIRILKHGRPRRSNKKHGLPKVYRGEVVVALEQIWEVCGRICSKRLHPFLPEMVKVLERCGELQLPAETKRLLLQMSSATIDRCLGPARFEHPSHGLSTTKPGSLLKKAIPVRTFTPWDEDKPGFLEIDLVAHCGGSVEGQYINTLTCVDLSTGWIECLAVHHRTQQAVFEAIRSMRTRLPFLLLGLDSDNGGEFINALLYQYCLSEEITFTRSRPYQKNDQAHVEQKNWSVVRRLIGYDRFETEEEYLLLQSIYTDLRLYANFFQPVLKLVSKEHVDKKLIKRYDTAATPYQRVLAANEIPFETKARLTNLYVQLNPVHLRTTIDEKVAKLWKIPR
ncbi:MAG: transposase family protein [Anaerolineales bacterium]|nr:transposase family protein [Anaerolineales bacterium]